MDGRSSGGGGNLMRLQRIWHWLLERKVQVGAVVFWVVVLVAARQYMTTNDLTFVELTNELRTTLTDEWYGPLLYLAVYLLRPLILFPAALLTILAGNIWGLGVGFLYGLIAGTASVVLPYVIGRWFADEDMVDEQISDEEATILQRFTGLLRRNPFQAVLTMRLLYLPYDAVSLLAGNLRISFLTFFLATALGNIGGTFSFVGIGASVEGDIASGQVEFNPEVLVFSAVVLVASFLISRYLSNRQRLADEPARLQDEEDMRSSV